MTMQATRRVFSSTVWQSNILKYLPGNGAQSSSSFLCIFFLTVFLIILLRSNGAFLLTSSAGYDISIPSGRGLHSTTTLALSIRKPVEINDKALPADLFGEKDTSPESVIRLLFVSKSKPTNYKRRRLGRNGWIQFGMRGSRCWCSLKDKELCRRTNQVCQFRQLRWAHRYAIGSKSLPETVVEDVNTELRSDFDFLLYPDKDAYTRLTWKVMWILKHVSSNVKYDFLVLLDDDCFAQIWRINHYIMRTPRQRFYGGHVTQYPVPVARPSLWSKWAVSREQYDNAHYPPFAWGAGLFLSADSVSATVQAGAKWKRPWFGVDDAFMGVLLNESGIPVVDITGIYTAGYYKAYGCLTDYSLVGSQPLVVAGDEEETLKFIAAVSEDRSLCTVLAGPIRSFLLFASSPWLPLSIVFAVVVAMAVFLWHRKRSQAITKLPGQFHLN